MLAAASIAGWQGRSQPPGDEVLARRDKEIARTLPLPAGVLGSRNRTGGKGSTSRIRAFLGSPARKRSNQFGTKFRSGALGGLSGLRLEQ